MRQVKTPAARVLARGVLLRENGQSEAKELSGACAHLQKFYSLPEQVNLDYFDKDMTPNYCLSYLSVFTE